MALGTLVPLKLEHVFDLRLSFGEELRIGPTSLGHSRVIHLVAGGTVSGPRLSGVVIPNSGSDAPCRAEDRTVIEGELMIRALAHGSTGVRAREPLSFAEVRGP
jgi:hypothetical protein